MGEGAMKKPTGAKWEIIVDGVPRARTRIA
jgi:hypothetical protein